jgi:hypothetical protein
MDIKLQKKLLQKYPKIFRQKDLPIQQTCMCWGIECGSGWYNIIDTLCSKIQKICEAKHINIEAVQVKEKFGGLRFYTNYSDDDIDKQIERAEEESYKTCESCGSLDKVTQTKGWIVTLCDKCMKTYKKEHSFK